MSWNSIDTAPHDVEVLLYSPPIDGVCDARIEVRPYSTGRRVGLTSNISTHATATHWKPLPEPPGAPTDIDYVFADNKDQKTAGGTDGVGMEHLLPGDDEANT